MRDNSKQILKEIRIQVLGEIDLDKIEAIIDNRAALNREISKVIQKVATQNKKYLSTQDLVNFSELISDEIMGLGPLRALMENPNISDILVNGPDNIFIEMGGKLQKAKETFIDNDQLTDVAKRLVARMGRRIDDGQPLVDARMPDGSRLNVVIKPIAIDGTSVSIRKFNNSSRSLEELAEFGSMSKEIVAILTIAAYSRCNIVVSGGTGSGKTTLLNALSQHISEDERIVTLEDAAELKIKQPHLVRLETRMAGVEKSGQVTMRDLVINALRMRPDRIIVGECRGGEAFEMLQAMNTGHDGSMTTVHANSPRDAISRLENLVMMAGFELPLDAIRYNISSAVDLIVQIARLNDGSRRVMKVTEIMGMDDDGKILLADVFEFIPDGKRDENNKIKGVYVAKDLPKGSIISRNATMFGVKEILDKVMQKAMQNNQDISNA